MTALTVHHLEHSRSQRVLWLLEELELPYELVRYERDPRTKRAPATLEAIHPLGKSPVITDGELVLAESGAIVEHLVEVHGEGRLRPEPGTEAHRRYRFWLHYAEGSLMPPLLVRFIFARLERAPVPFFVKPLVRSIVRQIDGAYTGPELARHVGFIERELGERPWLCGDELCAADVQMSFPLEALSARKAPSLATPRVDAYLARVRARPAYQRALERGGPYDLAFG